MPEPSAEVFDLSIRRAKKLIEEGISLVNQNRFHEARTLFSRSVDIRPTSEGYTYLAWMLSFEGYLEEAIDLCREAIRIDPAFGNPYNDIGSYLVRLNRLDEAVPWFKQAMAAERYEPKHFPHLNLANVFLAQGKIADAEREFREVLRYDPGNIPVHMILARLQKEKED